MIAYWTICNKLRVVVGLLAIHESLSLSVKLKQGDSLAREKRPTVVRFQDSLRKTDLRIDGWNGRLGNNMLQLSNAIIFAQRNAMTTVGLPSIRGPINDLFDFPAIMHVKPQTASLPHLKCANRTQVPLTGHWFPSPGCINPTDGEQNSVLQTHALPYANAELQDCLSTEGMEEDDDNLLTIHIRSGDIFAERHGHKNHRQPPCAFYEKVFMHGNDGKPFQRMLVITSAAQNNPCIARLLQKHWGRVSIQNSTALQDFCILAKAKNLVLSHSTFVVSAAYLSSDVARVFVATPQTCPGVCIRTRPDLKVFNYHIPGAGKLRPNREENVKWMVEYPEANVYENQCSQYQPCKKQLDGTEMGFIQTHA